MEARSEEPTGVSNLVVAIVLLAAFGGVAFLAWRRAAPLSRYVRNRRSKDRPRRGPTRKRTPGTDPI